METDIQRLHDDTLDRHIRVIDNVYLERIRQEKLKLQGKFYWTCADLYNNNKPITTAEKLSVLAEEFGEVARLVTETVIDSNRYNPKELMKELIQVAAVAVAWCEAIDKEIG